MNARWRPRNRDPYTTSALFLTMRSISSMRSARASTRRTIASIVVRSLYTGITTDRSGSVLIIGKNTPYHTMNRLVILAPNWLGDAVMALPAIADVRRVARDAHIVVAARPRIEPLFRLVPDVNVTVVLEPPAPGGRASTWRTLGSELATWMRVPRARDAPA